MPTPRIRCEMRAMMPATLPAMEAFCRDFRAQCCGSLRSGDRFAVELLLREALSNALCHGCGQEETGRIQCIVRLTRRCLVMLIADNGRGFDWRAAWGRRTPTISTTGRGMHIFREYASRVRFNRKGNALIILRRLEQGASQ